MRTEAVEASISHGLAEKSELRVRVRARAAINPRDVDGISCVIGPLSFEKSTFMLTKNGTPTVCGKKLDKLLPNSIVAR